LTAHSKDGSITVTVPRDGTAYRVRVRTGDGSEQVSVPTDPRSRQRMDLTTGDGSIHVTDRR
jgi:hypothetical protein